VIVNAKLPTGLPITVRLGSGYRDGSLRTGLRDRRARSRHAGSIGPATRIRTPMSEGTRGGFRGCSGESSSFRARRWWTIATRVCRYRAAETRMEFYGRRPVLHRHDFGEHVL